MVYFQSPNQLSLFQLFQKFGGVLPFPKPRQLCPVSSWIQGPIPIT